MTVSIPSLSPIDSSRAWIGKDLAAKPDVWIKRLTEREVADLEQAAAHYLAHGRDVGEITAEAFPVQDLGPWLQDLRETLLQGIGFQVIRGLPVERYDRQTVAAIFCGIGAHLGSAQSQNAAGHILGHVRDVGADPKNQNTRIYQTAERQTFHTDSSDAVGLLCLKNAKEGGDSLLVSAVSIFNRLVEERPDLMPLLFDPIATDRRGEIPDGEKPFMTIPPLSWHEGELTVFYQRQYINSGQRFEGVFPMTDAHVEALDLFDAMADDPDLHLRMRLEPGDMQFVYNHAFLHDRTGFTDWPDPAQRRHLLRLWLSLPGDRSLPKTFKQRYGSIEIGSRGGIITRETTLHAPLD